MSLISRIAFIAFFAGLTSFGGAGLTGAAWAEAVVQISPTQQKQIDRFVEAVQMPEVMAVMRDEGVDYGKSLEEEMFPGRGGAGWGEIVDTIYGQDKITKTMINALAQELAQASDEDIDQIIEFFESKPGQDFVTLEIQARRALLDKDVEEAATVAWQDVLEKDKPRAKLIERFVAANDLIESNVMGALNANLSFYKGLASEGGLEPAMTEPEILQEVWSQEDMIRSDMQAWLYPYLSMAYQSVALNDLEAYVAFSETTAGRKMNAALFAAYDTLFTQISFDLGAAAARQVLSNDI